MQTTIPAIERNGAQDLPTDHPDTPAVVGNPRLASWVADMAALCQPDHIHWCDGSPQEYDQLCALLVRVRHLSAPQPG